MLATDPAHDATDEEIRRLLNRLHGAYAKAFKEIEGKTKADLERQAADVDTSWTLVDADTVAALVRDQPDLLPRVSPEPSRAEAWARKKITSAITQSVLVGDSVPAASRRLRSVVDMDERAATRAARTALTGAENAGRVSSYDRARGMGIDVRARWMATLDSRTRDSHRKLDGEVAGDDGRFSNGLRYPGDPTGPASEGWNCRCTLVPSMPSADAFEGRNKSKLETSYEDWKAGRDPKRPKPSGRTLKEFMETPATERAAQRAGVSTGQLRGRIVARLKAEGRTGRDFPSMSRAEQQAVLKEAVELTRKQDKPRRNVKVVNDALYNSQKYYVERHGGKVIRGDKEWEDHLDKMGAGASAVGDTIILRNDATTSEVLEEVFHFRQSQRGDYSEFDAETMRYLRERDAQMYLLDSAKRYKIPEKETAQTRKALAYYLEQLRGMGVDADTGMHRD